MPNTRPVGKYMVAEDMGIEWALFPKNSHEPLAAIVYYPKWKSFVCRPYDGCEFDPKCLRAIADFLDELNKERAL